MTTFSAEYVGNFRKLRDCSGIINGQKPAKLNPKYDGKRIQRVQFDLNVGERFKDEGGGEKLETILMFIDEMASEGDRLKDVIGADFVSSRNLLTSIVRAVYTDYEFGFQVVRRNDVIFLCKIDEPHATDIYEHWGYKIEQYLKLDDNGNENDYSKAPSNAEQEKVVIRSKLKNGSEELKLFYTAEVDAIDKCNNYVEIKSTSGNRNEWFYEHKSLRIFIQSYLANIKTILFASRTRDGIVYKVVSVPTNSLKLPSLVDWNLDHCLDKLFETLKEVKNRLDENDKAFEVRRTQEGYQYSEIDPEICDFVPSSFYEKYL